MDGQLNISAHFLSRCRPTNTLNEPFDVNDRYYTENVMLIVGEKVVIVVCGEVVAYFRGYGGRSVDILWQTVGFYLRG